VICSPFLQLCCGLAALALVVDPGATPAADLRPAPQRFEQEVATQFVSTHGLPAGGVQLVDLPSDNRPTVLARSCAR
jgi:hypothetical protein